MQATSPVRKTVLFFLAIALALPLHAGEWGSRGVSRRFVVSGDRLFAADGRGVSVYDVSNPAGIRRIDIEAGLDETNDLALGGDRLHVATARGIDRFAVGADGSLTRLDSLRGLRNVSRIAASDRIVAAVTGTTVTVFEESTTLRQIKFVQTVRAVAVIDGLLYMSVLNTGLFVHDPLEGEIAFVPVEAADLARSGSTLWVVGPQGLAAVDVSNPAAPQITGRVTDMNLVAVAASGTRVYAIEAPDKLHVFDAQPRLVSTVREWVNVIAASGAHVFAAGRRLDHEGMPFETGVPVRAYDATNLASLAVAGELTDLAGPVSGAWTDGSIAFIVDPPFLRVLDVSTTAQPREIASLVVPRIQDRIRVRNGMAVLYGRSDVNFIDVSDPRNPKYLATWDAEGHPPSAAAFLRDTVVEANEHSGLHILDYSDAANPRLIASRIWHYHDVAASDDAVYAMLVSQLVVLDLTNRTKVVERKFMNTAGYDTQLDTIPPISGSPEYLVFRGPDGLAFFSLRENRFDPREIGTVAVTRPDVMATSATGVHFVHDGALFRVDVADLTQVIETGERVLSPQQIAVSGDKVVVADRYSVRVFGPDTAPPPPPAPTKRRALRH